MEVGLCQCGCGEKTEICKKTQTSKGYVKGQPKKFLLRHGVRGERSPVWKGGQRVTKWGYVYALASGHPSVNSRGYVPEHILVCEKALGKYLPLQAVVHHVNKNTADNLPSNLVVCQDNAYHLYLHQRQRAFDACGHTDWLKCRFCKGYDDPKNLRIKKHKNHNYAEHRVCENLFQKKRYKLKKEKERAHESNNRNV